VVIVQDLFGLGKDLRDAVPDPGHTVCNHTEPHPIFGNKSCLLDGTKRCSKLLIRADLLPADEVPDSILVNQVKTQSLELVPVAFTPFSFLE
jgi:hypothetical protein